MKKKITCVVRVDGEVASTEHTIEIVSEDDVHKVIRVLKGMLDEEAKVTKARPIRESTSR